MATKKKTAKKPGAKKTRAKGAAKKTRAKGAAKETRAKGAAKKTRAKGAAKQTVGWRSSTTAKVPGVPTGYQTVTAHLIVSPCMDAIRFYERAFGAKTLGVMDGPGGVVMHAELQIGSSRVMLSDEMPMPGQPPYRMAPRSARATTCGIHLYVPDTDQSYQRAVDAGATGVMAPHDAFWGDRYAQLQDPFGHVWAMATRQTEMSYDEMKAAAARAFAPPG